MAFWSDETFCVIVNEAKDITFGFATDHVYVFEKTIAETGILSTIDIRKDNSHTSHTKIRHTTINYAALGIWKRFFQFSGSLLIKRDTSSAIWNSDAL